MIGMIDPSVMLCPEFILRAARSWITLNPERFDESVPLPIGFQFEKDLFFQSGDDVADFFFEPFLVSFRKVIFIAGISAKEKNKCY
jgi:hypothetical protein